MLVKRKGGDALKGMLNDQSLIYQQIAQLLEDGILRGEYPPETPGAQHQ